MADTDIYTSLTLMTILGAKGEKITLRTGEHITLAELHEVASDRKIDDLIRRKALIKGKYGVREKRRKLSTDSYADGEDIPDPFAQKNDKSIQNPIDIKDLIPMDSYETIDNTAPYNTKPEDTLPRGEANGQFADRSDMVGIDESADEGTYNGDEVDVVDDPAHVAQIDRNG